MATYNLKYYAEIQNFRGQFARVEILQRSNSAFSVLEIGDVCGLVLEIQGGQEDIFTPIVKTQARLSMISCDDKPTAGGVKYGGWSEFYTSDSTLYKMVIKTKPNASADSWTTRWSGYITPDSWREGLEYHGAITITARDNIGHLQDFEFDGEGYAYGLSSIRSLLTVAMNKIELPMNFRENYDGEDVGCLEADGVAVLDAMINVSKFSGRDWYSVIEDIINSIGYTLRFTDNNTVTLAPMRYLPLQGEAQEEDQPAMADLEFYGGDAEIVPAVKKITETHNYDYNGEIFLPIISDNMAFGTDQTYRCKVEGNEMPGGGSFSRPEHDAVYNKVTAATGTVWETGSDILNVNNLQANPGDFESEGDRWKQYAFLAANGVDTSIRKQAMSFFCGTTDVTVKAIFASRPAGLYTRYGETKVYVAEDSLYKIKYSIWFTGSGITRYWNGTGWQNNSCTIDKEFDPQNEFSTDLEIALKPCLDLPNGGILHLAFEGIWYKMFYNTYALDGVYARLSGISVGINVTNLSKNTVRTINDEKYNILLERTTEISPLSREVSVARPANYPSALFYYPGGGSVPAPYPYMMNWDTVEGNNTKPLPVLVHQQILCYRGGNLWQLNGDCAPRGGGLFWFNALCNYKGRTYLLQSGTLDFTTGNVQGAILREFLEYDDIWDDTVPAEPGEPGEWQDTTSYPGSGAASSSSSPGSSLAPGGGVNFFEEDTEHTFASGKPAIKLKDVYAGLWSPGFMAQFGVSETEGVSGVTLENVWKSLMNILADHTYDNSEIAKQHLTAIWQLLAEASNNVIHGSHLPVATTQALGGVKVDGTSIFINNNGVISGFAGGGLNGLTAPKKIILCTSYPASMDADAIYLKVEVSS